VLDRLDGAIDVRSLVSHRPSLADGPELFARMEGKKEKYSKVVFSL
jgi:threonine dehydrogenase-like Zn-dependent dehydrogenase